MKNKKEMLLLYMRANVAPILIDFVFEDVIKDAIIIPACLDLEKLNGKYCEEKILPPKWFEEIVNAKGNKILVIDKIDSIEKEEQLKFCELLKYRKISTFKLPQNCVIIVTADNINKDTVNEKLFSLVACI